MYRGALFPDLVGRYFYADYVEGTIWSLRKTSSSPDVWSLPQLELDTSLNISAFGEDEGGEMYVVDWGGGTVRRLAAMGVPAPSLTATQKDFFFPGTQPSQLDAEIQPSFECDTCHSAPIYDAWRGTMMSQAGRDPLVWAALSIANVDAPGAGDLCLRCHAPQGWLEGRGHAADGSALQSEDMDSGVA